MDPLAVYQLKGTSAKPCCSLIVAHSSHSPPYTRIILLSPVADIREARIRCHRSGDLIWKPRSSRRTVPDAVSPIHAGQTSSLPPRHHRASLQMLTTSYPTVATPVTERRKTLPHLSIEKSRSRNIQTRVDRIAGTDVRSWIFAPRLNHETNRLGIANSMSPNTHQLACEKSVLKALCMKILTFGGVYVTINPQI